MKLLLMTINPRVESGLDELTLTLQQTAPVHRVALTAGQLTLVASGGAGGYTYSVSAGLPSGLTTVDSATGQIGVGETPTTIGHNVITATVTDSDSNSVTATFSIDVLTRLVGMDVTPPTDYEAGNHLYYQYAVTGNTGTVTWTISGTYNGGITTSGYLTLISYSTASMSFTVTATDSGTGDTASFYSKVKGWPALSNVTAETYQAVVGVPLPVAIGLIGGKPPYTYALNFAASETNGAITVVTYPLLGYIRVATIPVLDSSTFSDGDLIQCSDGTNLVWGKCTVYDSTTLKVSDELSAARISAGATSIPSGTLVTQVYPDGLTITNNAESLSATVFATEPFDAALINNYTVTDSLGVSIAYNGFTLSAINPNPLLQTQAGGTDVGDAGISKLNFAGATVSDDGSGVRTVTIPSTSPPSGAAGGDLTGTYPNPTIKTSVALTGTPTAPTAAVGTNTDQIATMAAIKAAIDALIGGAPGALDTLNELAAALGDDASFSASVTAALATKAVDSAVVHLTGAETIAGVKSFTSQPKSSFANASYRLQGSSQTWDVVSIDSTGRLYFYDATNSIYLAWLENGLNGGIWTAAGMGVSSSNPAYVWTSTSHSWLHQLVDADGRLRLFCNDAGIAGEKFSFGTGGDFTAAGSITCSALHLPGATSQYVRGDGSLATLPSAGITAISGNAPVNVSAGSTPTVSMQSATGSRDGYLTSTNWTTFNGKQDALGYTAANDANVVHTTGTETIGGAKTFTSALTGTTIQGTTVKEISSDERIKTNITRLPDCTADLMQLRPIRYLRTDTNEWEIGFTAQSVQPYFPDLTELCVLHDGTERMRLDYQHMVAPIVDVVQRQQRLIEALTARLNALESKA